MSQTVSRPRKRFGQNFLVDQGVARRIVSAARLAADDAVLEIGPGRGALTAPLLEVLNELTAIEVDRDLAAALRERWPARLALHEGDALDFDYSGLLLGERAWSVLGNLPYNISTPLLLRLAQHAGRVRQMLFMLQQEVVDRLCANAGSKAFGRLSVMVGYYFRAEPLFEVAAGSFHPVPKVRSRIVRLVPRDAPPMPAALPALARAAFGQRRKTLRNALAGWIDADGFAALGIDPAKRPETLCIDDFVRLAGVVRVPGASDVRDCSP